MDDDGKLSLTLSAVGNGIQHFNGDFQVLPWLDVSFRYSRAGKLPGSTSAYYDRSFGFKVRLSRETESLPELSLGFRDALGTGIYSGEYLVASKHFNDLEFTLGAGWGRFAGRAAFNNPFGAIFPSFNVRQNLNTLTGTVAFGQFFHGPKVGLFGGVVWKTPIDDLDFLLEYSSDNYALEHKTVVNATSPVNVGFAYHLFDVSTISAGWFYGTTYGVTVNLSMDPAIPASPFRVGPQVPAPAIRSDMDQARALDVLLARTRQPAGVAAGAPWVKLPATADRDDAALTSAIISENRSVHDVEVVGKTLMVDSRDSRSFGGQCERYSLIAANFQVPVSSVAVTNLGNGGADVTICAVAHDYRRLARTLQRADGDIDDDGPLPSGAGQSERAIREHVALQAIRVEALSVERSVVWLYFSNDTYRVEDEAVGRMARVLMADAPPNVEVFHIVSVKRGEAERDFQIARSSLERAIATYGSSVELGHALSLQAPPLANPILALGQQDTYPRLHWAIGPGLRQSVFNPNRPLEVQVFAALNVALDVTPTITLQSSIEANVYNNFDLTTPADSQLPHVRTDIVQYYRHGINGIAQLEADYHRRLARDIYFEARVGYLESMFAGAGLQMLWRPDGERFSIGADIYQVWKRNFDRLYGLDDYHVVTGSVNVYYQSPWHDLNFNVHMGRYLAGDYGATFEVTRRFDTGVEIGAFATFTNVPFSKFGEGSFDKGLILKIPFEWALPFYSQSAYNLTLRSLTRDGGQRLDGDDSLYDETLATSYGEILGQSDDVIAP